MLEGGVAAASSGTQLLSSDVYRPPTREDISRPGSTRAAGPLEFLSQIPKPPAYDRRIANSRSSSKGADARASSLSRGTSRERARLSPHEAPFILPSLTQNPVQTHSPPQQHPPILPELQHLVAPPPPPPPPPPIPASSRPHLFIAAQNLSNVRGFDHDAANVPLPMSAIPTSFSELPNSANSLSMGHRRGRSGNEGNGSSSNQIFGKIRNFAGRVRSPSRGRRADDNQAMSPRLNNEHVAPYESIPGALASSVGS